MNKKQKKVLVRIIIAAVLMIVFGFLPVSGYLRFGLYMIPYLVIGYDILRKAWKGILNRQMFDENFLMAVATIGAIVLGEYTEGVAVMLFYQIGELFQSYAVGKSRRNISELMDIRPDYANIEGENGLEKVDPDEVEIGSIIVVQPGEKVPIDGVIVEGEASLNTSALTGESLPREAKTGDAVISGCIDMTGVLKIRTTKEFGESTVSKILDTVSDPACDGNDTAVEHVDLPGPDFLSHQLPMCPGNQHSAQLFCRNRRRQQCRRSGKGFQLFRDSVPDKICGI